MIEVIPSIYVMDGKVARLEKGDFSKAVFYEQTPIDIAQEIESKGFKRLHLVDLDGVKVKNVVNEHVLHMISAYTKLKVDYSGGLRMLGSVNNALREGASRVTVGTVAAFDRPKFKQWLISIGRDIFQLAADFRNEMIVAEAWSDLSDISLWDHLDYYKEQGIIYVKATDTDKEGGMTGPSIDIYKEIRDRYPEFYLTVSGGVQSVEEVQKLDEIGVNGVIIGKALHDNVLTLNDLKDFTN